MVQGQGLLRFHLGGLHSCLDSADVEAICRSHLVNPGVDATAGLLLRQLRSLAQELLDQPLHHTESSVSVSSLVSSCSSFQRHLEHPVYKSSAECVGLDEINSSKG